MPRKFLLSKVLAIRQAVLDRIAAIEAEEKTDDPMRTLHLQAHLDALYWVLQQIDAA